MKQRLGYTLVELMIVISIVAILLTFGISAYGKARDRQLGQAASEQVLTLLQESQKKANIGDKDCTGKYLGQQVITGNPNIITSQSICEGNVGVLTTTTIPNISSLVVTTITFNPLASGTTLTTAPLNLDIVTSSGSTWRILLNTAGVIEFKGML